MKCGFLTSCSSCFSAAPELSLVLDGRGRLGGKVGSVCEELQLEDTEGGILG